jgi:uncharacterized protein (TIGR01319 family)
MDSYLIVDVDDLVTKAILVERSEDGFDLKGIGEAATTVESPDLDVNLGVGKAIEDLGRDSGVVLPATPEEGVSRFLCSSSSGGGLHMMVAGLIGMISAESGKRAALGAGAYLRDVFSIDDGRQDYEKVERMRSLRPDIFLLTGGTDGGNVKQVVGMAELIKTADVKPRFGEEFMLPLIFAGNIEIRDRVSEALDEEKYALRMVGNVRPVLEEENLGPAKEGIYDAYMEHIIVHSPGYGKLLDRVDEAIIPSQAAIGEALFAYAKERGANLIGVDIGSATTDVYSVYDGVFNRSLNADLGIGYSINNVMKEAGVENVLRWLPEDFGEEEVRDTIGNMMIHLAEPGTSRETLIHEAAAREAIRLGLQHHKTIATRLKGIHIQRTIADIFDQEIEDTYLHDMMSVDVLVGKGAVFSSAPRVEEAALLLVDALQPEGVTEILMDRRGLLPHLGSLTKVDREAALEIMSRACLSNLGTCIAPRGAAEGGEEVLRIVVRGAGGWEVIDTLAFGELRSIPLEGEEAEVEVLPSKRFDMGSGRGKSVTARVAGGVVGLFIDARGRPLDPAVWKGGLVAGDRALIASPDPRVGSDSEGR